jgi:membrane-bound ClpP family serine protease
VRKTGKQTEGVGRLAVFGLPIEQLYLIVLVAAGLATVLYLFFGDVADGAGEALPFLNPAVILAFITFMSASGFIFENVTGMGSVTILAVSAGISAVLSFLLYFFVLLPLRSAESSTAYTEQSLLGQVGRVITPVPEDGFGEVVIETVNGLISKRAAGLENAAIDYDREVLIIEIRDGTLIVKEYEPFRFKELS